MVRQAACTKCPLSGFVDDPREICTTGSGAIDASIMVVSKMPDSKKYRELVTRELRQAGINTSDVLFTGAVKCATYERSPSRKDVKVCSSEYLTREIEIVNPNWILALGNEALQATAGKSGITKYRGQTFGYGDATVFPTVSPAMVLRNPQYLTGWKADISFFANMVLGRNTEEHIVRYRVVDSKEQLHTLVKYLKNADVVAYDVETNGFEEFKSDSAIVTLSLTLNGPKYKRPATFVIPLFHPQSVWRKSWTKVLQVVAPHLTSIRKQIAHNGKFDDRWLRQFGVEVTCTFDTMLAAHLIDENRSKSLKNLARTMLGAPAWDISTKNLLSTPMDIVAEYNAHDTYWTYQLYLMLREQLIERPRLARLFMRLMMPASADLTESERRGIWTDRERLASNTKIAYDTLVFAG